MASGTGSSLTRRERSRGSWRIATSSFRSYTSRGFDHEHQVRLRDQVVRLAELGAIVVLSNSVAPSVLALYRHAAVRRAGLRCYRVQARRAINSDASSRGAVEELVVTNAAYATHADTRQVAII